jgi:transcriptional regulator with XRE-family HTH domain
MPKITDKITKILPRTWTPNQVVAHNLTRARILRGWTQDQAAAELAPYLGFHLSAASFSAIERSIAGSRVKQFTADELVALSRAFDLPLGWWLTPPPDGAMHTPDHQRTGIDFNELVDIVLGTRDTLPAWTDALQKWGAERAKTTILTAAERRRAARPAEQIELRARTLVRERFGDLTEARDVLRRLAEVLDALDDPAAGDTDHPTPSSSGKTTHAAKTANAARPPAPTRRTRRSTRS